jgi:hypothetical protein
VRAKISVGLKYDILFYAMGLVESFRHPFLYAMPNPYEAPNCKDIAGQPQKECTLYQAIVEQWQIKPMEGCS